MKLKQYIHTAFPGLILKPSLYDQWNQGIHFELAKGLSQMKEESDELDPKYFQTVYEQATTLFNELFSDEDHLFLVTNVYQFKDGRKSSKRKIKVYYHYIKNKDVRFRLKQETLPYPFDDEEDADELCTAQFALQCQKQHIDYSLLIQAICNQDFPSLTPRLHNPYDLYYPNIFFINVTKNVIFYIYDDRGCEVIASDMEMIRPIYEKYNDWIDEYYREEIEERLK